MTTLRTRLRSARQAWEITRVGFGACASAWGDWEFGWGPQQDDQSIATIHRALVLGFNRINTAAAYGFRASEEVVGRALEGMTERPNMFTKCSLVEGPGRTGWPTTTSAPSSPPWTSR